MFRSLVTVVLLATAAHAQCTKADASCMEKVPLGPKGRHSAVYRSFPLTQANPQIRRALIVIHGAGRNADSYYVSAVAGALIGGALQDTVVIAPRLASNTGSGCNDTLGEGEISWTCGGPEDWRRGGKGAGLDVTTFDLVDELLRRMADKKVFPNLRTIVVTGHSAGGQFTNRYAAASKVGDTVGVPVRYVVSNPSSYLYLDDVRLEPGARCTADGKCSGRFVSYADSDNCTTFNRWHYGMNERSGYAGTVSDADLKKNLIGRDVVYLLGDQDTLPIGGFDSSCPAMAQGQSRFARGLNYWNYMKSLHGARHKVVVVPFCGHNGRCMYTADPALPVIFPQ